MLLEPMGLCHSMTTGTRSELPVGRWESKPGILGVGAGASLCGLVWGPPGGPEAGGGGRVSSSCPKQDRLRLGWPSRVVSQSQIAATSCSDFSLGCTWGAPQSHLELLHRGGQDIEVRTRNPRVASPDPAGAVLGEPQGVWEMGGGTAESSLRSAAHHHGTRSLG